MRGRFEMGSMRKKLLLLAVLVSSFATGYGVLAQAYPSTWPYGMNEYYGYFQNQRDTAGKYVLTANCSGAYNYWNGQDNCNAFPNTMNTASEFTGFVIGKLSSSTATDRHGAAFIIQTMIGTSRTNPPTVAQQQEFINRVNAIAPYTLWGSTSFVYNLNSYNQRGNDGVGPNDIAFYDDNQSGHRALIFRNSSGGVEYVIKTRCANPVGFNTIEPLPPAFNFTLTPSVNATITSGGVPISGDLAEQGDTITFTYAVNNAGATDSQVTTCTYYQATYPGHNETPPTSPFIPGGANCPPPRTFPRNTNTTTVIENVVAASANTSICRSITVSPATPSGGSAIDQTCVFVTGKPYTRVWGGDISAGNGLADVSGACTSNLNAAVVGWNKRPAGGSGGAGVQFGIFALGQITDFASALYDAGGAAEPVGLSFANVSTDAAAGDFGGEWGSASCIPDYYATRPATVIPLPPTVAAMTTGVYGGSGNITLGGGSIVNPNNRITVYVDGNVYISSNITYSGNWNTSSVPLFELIVRGNIYIDNDVTQLDGAYVAQVDGSGNFGQIHTCATGFSELALQTLSANCTRKLTVNGLFTANQIRLLRTMGSLAQSSTGEASTAPHIAEVFNFGPAIWMKQPVRQANIPTPDYDAIISLPPVL